MSGIELATAYVSIVGDTRGLAKDIDKALNSVDGRSAGRKLSTNIAQGMGAGNGAISQAGAQAAQAYQTRLQSSIRGAEIGEKIGTVIGKGLGFGIKAGLAGVAAITATAVAGVGLALTKGFDRLKNIDNATFKLKSLGNSASDVKSIMNSALESVKGTAFGLDSAANTAATATAAGVAKGKDLTDYLTNVADAAAIAQTSLDEMGSIFNKVQTNGKAMTDDLQMLADRGLPIFTWLQKQYGVTGDALQKMVEDGKVSSADFQRAIHDNIAGAAKGMGQSFEGAMQNVNAALGRLGATLLAPGFGNASGGITGITNALDGLNAWVGAHQNDLIDFWSIIGHVAVEGTKQVVLAASDMLEAVAGLTGGIGNVLGAVSKFQAWQADIRGDHDTAKELRAIAEEQFSWGENLQSLSDKLADVAKGTDGLNGKIDDWVKRAKDAKSVTDALGDSFVSVKDNGQIVISSNAPEVMEKVNGLGAIIKELPDGQFEVIAKTPEAQSKLDAFIAKNGVLPPAKLPVEPGTQGAQDQIDAFIGAQAGRRIEISARINIDPNSPIKFPGGTPTVGGIPIPGDWSGSPSVGGIPIPGLPSPATPDGFLPYQPGMNNGRRIPGRASGGDISGPGPKGRDSVLMYGAPGEHMWTAKEVDAVGGQGNMYKLRSMALAGQIPGFERGGGIKDAEIIGSGTQRGWLDNDMNGTPGQQRPRWSDKAGPGLQPGPVWNSKGGPSRRDSFTFPWEPWIPLDPYRQNRRGVRALGSSSGIPGFDEGGAIPAIDYAYGEQGQPYQYGSFDCSMFASQIYARMAGLPPGRYFNTESDFEAMGFKPGFKPGALNVGIRRGGGGPNSHMAVTLPNGVSAENSGNGAMYGGNAHGADTFPLQYYYEPPNAGDIGDMQQAGAQQSAVDPNTTVHGAGMGAAPGPQDTGGTAGGPGGDGQVRTEGYIPAAAGNTSVAGTSFLSGIYGMGAEVINGVIDQAASAASSAASMAATAFAPGSGGAAGGLTSAAIGIGTQAAKRGVQYGAQMLGILTDATIEQLTPFGAPRILTTDPTGFMPQQLISGAISDGISNAFKPQQPGQPGDPGQGAPPALTMPGPTAPGGAGAPGASPAPAAAPPAQQPPVNPLTQPWNLLNGGIFDSGGMLQPGGVAVNLGKKPEPVLTSAQWDSMASQPAVKPGATYNIYPKDVDDAVRQLRNKERLDMMQHAGRP